MMRMRRLNIYLAVMLIIFEVSKLQAQQTIQFSQYVFNGLAVNPAYAGYKEAWTGSLSYRMQWAGLDGAPRTATASFDGVTDDLDKKVGLGVIVTNDRLGAQNTSSIYGNYAYRLQLDDYDTRRLSFGIAFGATQYSVDGSKFIATDQGDGSIPIGNENKLTPDLRIGVYYYTPKFYFGASVIDLFSAIDDGIMTAENYKILRQVRHIYVTGGVMFRLSEILDLKSTFMIKEDFKGPTSLDLNTYLLIGKKIWLGGSWRTGVRFWDKSNLQKNLDQSDAVSGIVEIYLSDRFRIGYSFDYTTSKLANYQQGSHEVSLSITLPGKKERILSPRYF